MPEAESNLPTKTEPQTTSLHPQKLMYKSSTIITMIPAKNPVEIGTRGTIGFLITKEIKYLNHLELGSPCDSDNSEKPTETASTSRYSKPKLGSSITTPVKKKKGASKFIPSMCSAVEVAEESNIQPNLNSKVSYRNLKADQSSRKALRNRAS